MATQIKAIQDLQRLSSTAQTYSAIAYLNFSRDVSKKKNLKEKEYYDKISPELQEISKNLAQTILQSNQKEDIKKEFGEHYINLLEMEEKTFDPAIKDLKIEESELKNRYINIIGNAKITYKGKKTYNLAGLSPFQTDPLRQTRKSSTKAAYRFFSKHEKELDEIYDKLVHVRHEMAKRLGYENYIDLAYLKMSRSDYNAKDVSIFRQEIKEKIVPIAQRLKEERRKRLGLKGLTIYDGIHFKDGNPKPKGSPEVLVQKHKKCIKNFLRIPTIFST